MQCPFTGSSSGHGRVDRGLLGATRSPDFEGRFGRMFRQLRPAKFEDAALRELAARMLADPDFGEVDQPDDEENSGLPAGYTYFGQFIDHDLTLDPTPLTGKQDDPEARVDFRTPGLDLDCLYGRGPDDQPYMYMPDGKTLWLGDRDLKGQRKGDASPQTLAKDLLRTHGRAIIGDKRNDENVIVSQLQGLFIRLHNKFATTHGFEEARRLVRWHYQWLVLYDYLPRLVGEDMVRHLLPHLSSGKPISQDPPKLKFFHWKKFPFMPVEFSGAAYRFGHSMVRPIYRLSYMDVNLPGDPPELGGRRPVFSPVPGSGLNGFGEFNENFGIDWTLFFDTRSHALNPLEEGRGRIQPAYKIDTSLVNPLKFLPEFSKPGSNAPADPLSPNNLALRNLLRGVTLDLPSGEAVAKFMGLKPLEPDQIRIGKALVEDNNSDGSEPLYKISPSFLNNTPLWAYVLAEGRHTWRAAAEALPGNATPEQKNVLPTRLGPVGGRIVAEVFIGLLYGGQDFFAKIDPTWQPSFGDPAAPSIFKRFIFGDLL